MDLKPKLISAFNRIKSIVSTIGNSLMFRLTKSLVKITLVLSLITYIIFFGQDVPRKFLRVAIANRVYTIANGNAISTGTGFAIKAASGKTYIMTNQHVCEAAGFRGFDGKLSVLLIDSNGEKTISQMYRRAASVDLCMTEAPEGVEGLKIGEAPLIGDIVTSIGHPNGLPTSLQSGEILGEYDADVTQCVLALDGIPVMSECMSACNKSYQKIVHVVDRYKNLNEANLTVCINVYPDEYQTNMIIYGGNSGSPVVDKLGRVVAVVNASNTRTNWGVLINHKYLKRFLDKH